MDVRAKILAILNASPKKNFSISEIAAAIASTSKATAAALQKLYKSDAVNRPEKGLYSSKKMSPEQAIRSSTRAPRSAKRAVAAKPVESHSPLSIVTVDLLVEGDLKDDIEKLLWELQQDKTILHGRIRTVSEADPTKLKIRVSLPE